MYYSQQGQVLGRNVEADERDGRDEAREEVDDHYKLQVLARALYTTASDASVSAPRNQKKGRQEQGDVECWKGKQWLDGCGC